MIERHRKATLHNTHGVILATDSIESTFTAAIVGANALQYPLEVFLFLLCFGLSREKASTPPSSSIGAALTGTVSMGAASIILNKYELKRAVDKKPETVIYRYDTLSNIVLVLVTHFDVLYTVRKLKRDKEN